MATFTLVTCSVTPARFAAATDSWRRALRDDVEVVGIHDARSLAEGYTRGLARAHGELVIFSHDDVDVLTPDAATLLATHLAEHDVVGIAGTRRLVGGGWYFAGDPHDFMLVVSPRPDDGTPVLLAEGAGDLVVPGIEALDGVVIAARTEVARAIGFDAATFDHFHLYDLDFTYRAHRAGYRLAVCRDLVVHHASTGSFDPVWDTYRLRFEAKFARELPASFRRTEPRILNERLDRARLADPDYRRAVADPARLQALLGRLGPTAAPG